MKVIGSRSDVRLFTITQGAGVNFSGRVQKFGARRGVSDIVGYLYVADFRAMVPPSVEFDRMTQLVSWYLRVRGGLFSHHDPVGLGFPLAIEVKVGRDTLKPKQRAFLDMVRAFGGIAIEARCVSDVIAVLP